jgi:hypothetical protein
MVRIPNRRLMKSCRCKCVMIGMNIHRGITGYWTNAKPHA